MNTPFIYGHTVSTQAFTNRENSCEKLYLNLTQGINTSIISPRRWGKSSLVEKVILDINKKHKSISTVQIDLFSVSNEEEFLELFAQEVIKASSNKWQDWVTAGKNFFKQLIPQITIGVDPNIDFSITFNWEELIKHKTEILNLPEKIAQKTEKNFIICIDEFQELANYPNFEGLEKSMRATWQRQKKVTYCLYGSKRHMMADIFNNSSKPFYKFGDILLLPKIEEDKWVSFIMNGFKRTKKSIPKAHARAIAKLMKNHSWYVQQLAHYIWQKTHKKTDLEIFNAALSELINANSPFYQKVVETISKTQLNMLKAISQGETQLSSAAVMRNYRLGTPRNVSKNKSILINDDLIDEANGSYQFLDPAFELWFRKIYFKETYLLDESSLSS